MAMDQFTNQFTGQGLVPFMDPMNALEDNVNIGPSLVVAKGTVLAQVTAAAADVQTITVTATGGTFIVTLTIDGVTLSTAALAYNVSLVNLQAALVALANVGTGGVVVTGTAGSSYVLTFGGNLANRPVPIATLTTTALTGGSATIAHTTVGQTLGTWVPYSSTALTAPTPVLTGASSGSAFAAGTYLVQLTIVTANGESTPSPEVPVTLTAGQKIHVAALSGLGASATAVNVYVDGTEIGTMAVTSGGTSATDFDVASDTLSGEPPTVNKAFSGAAGVGVPSRLNKYDLATDASGQITFGVFSAGTTPTGGQFGETYRAAPTFFSGTFKTTDLTGFDAYALSAMGARLISGTVSNGTIRLG